MGWGSLWRRCGAIIRQCRHVFVKEFQPQTLPSAYYKSGVGATLDDDTLRLISNTSSGGGLLLPWSMTGDGTGAYAITWWT